MPGPFVFDVLFYPTTRSQSYSVGMTPNPIYALPRTPHPPNQEEHFAAEAARPDGSGTAGPSPVSLCPTRPPPPPPPPPWRVLRPAAAHGGRYESAWGTARARKSVRSCTTTTTTSTSRPAANNNKSKSEGWQERAKAEASMPVLASSCNTRTRFLLEVVMHTSS